MKCLCGENLRLKHDDVYVCDECYRLYRAKTELVSTTLEIEAESEGEALSKAWTKMDNAMNITDIRVKKAIR